MSAWGTFGGKIEKKKINVNDVNVEGVRNFHTRSSTLTFMQF